ncbi:MAG: tetratricopeptide repeat protein [Hydrococcus sp. C42_A2020_068]|nr:tetratricopeptide repeat protein [Hydrococcus sp. C42_A2020_068]
MLERVVEAIERRDCERANRLLQDLKQQEPDHPWIAFYSARLAEASGNLAVAEQGYREVLCNATNPKIISQARQGIERLVQIERQQRQQERDRAMAEPGSQKPAVLVLEAIDPELRQSAAKKFAKIMNLDLYIARLQLPTRSWRLYRTGSLGELRFYSAAIAAAEIPCFCLPISRINAIEVYKVRYFQSALATATVICQEKNGRSVAIDFDWSQVSQRVEALLPLFEKCVDRDVRGRLIRKTQIQDYVKVCDLHLPGRNAIVRLWDRGYQFHEGIIFFDRQRSADGQTTLSEKWNHLMQFLQQQLATIPVWSDFNAFAGMARDFSDTLKLIDPQIDLFRREETDWDNTFQLYSGLVLLSSSRTPKPIR